MKKIHVPKRVKVTPQMVKDCAFLNIAPSPLYQVKGSKEPTTDITQAELDPFGRPIKIGYSKTEYTIDKDTSKPLCLDPSDPAQRLRAIEARARLENAVFEPTIYEEKIDAVSRTNNIANKVLNKITNPKPVESHEQQA